MDQTSNKYEKDFIIKACLSKNISFGKMFSDFTSSVPIHVGCFVLRNTEFMNSFSLSNVSKDTSIGYICTVATNKLANRKLGSLKLLQF